MSKNSVIVDLKFKLNTLTSSERIIADFVIHNSQNVPMMTIQDLAYSCNVSKPTVSRFAKNIGFESYRDFCNNLLISENETNNSAMVYNDISECDSIDKLCDKVFANNINALRETLSQIEPDILRAVLDKICSSRAVHIIGQGRSYIVAEAFSNRFYRLGVRCITYNDPHIEAVASALASEEDMVIGISTFGRSKSVFSSLKRAKENGACTVLFTGYSDSPMEDYADYTLKAVASQSPINSFEPSCETAAMFVIIDCLYMMYIVNNKEKVENLLEKSNVAIEEEKIKQ